MADLAMSLYLVFIGGYSGLQRHFAVFSGKHCQQSSEQDQQDGSMQDTHYGALIRFVTEQHDHHADGQHGPKGYKPPSSIHMTQGKV